MKELKLNNDQKAVLRQASRSAVEAYFSDLGNHFSNELWLVKSNRYLRKTLTHIKKDLTVTPSRINSKHLGEYIAASTVLHCMDGWSFLGRALNAHTNGDRYTAHHLAYYAELRAAASLLACEGIGVFDKRHFIIDASKRCVCVPGNIGTHVFAWLALKHWAGLTRSSSLLMEVVAPGGISLQDWLIKFMAGPNSSTIGSQWLMSWGLDLKKFSQDREGRNEVSYRPNYLKHEKNLTPLNASEFCRNFWELFEPYNYSRFEFLDRHLLRLSLRQAYQGTKGKFTTKKKEEFDSRIVGLLTVVNPGGLPLQEWKRFLLSSETHPLIEKAAEDNDRGSVSNHLRVIARAALLLRVATGAVSRLIRISGFDGHSFKFWWERVGEDLGLWLPPLEVELTELWADVEDGLSALTQWEESNFTNAPSYYSWNQYLAKELDILCSCERIGLWGLGL